MSSSSVVLAFNFVIKTILPLYIFPGLSAYLDSSVLFSTPVNSFKTLKEGWYLLTRLHIDPYEAMINHPPLLLQIAALLDADNKVLVHAVYSAADTLVLYNLIQITRVKKLSGFIQWCYLLNPLVTLGTISLNTTIFTNLSIVCSIKNLQAQKFNLSMIQLALASYLSIFPVYLVIPFAQYISRHVTGIPIKQLGIFAITSILLSLNSLSFGLEKVVQNCYVSILTFEKIQPNLGLWWYFFMEIFDFFHNFYIGVFNMYVFVFIVPLAYRFRSASASSLFTILVSVLWINLTKNYPTISDLNLSTLLLLSLGHSYLNKLRVPLALTAIVMSVVLVLLVLFYYLWVNLNSGNSNFFYGVGLVYNVIIAWTICDLIWVELQQEWFTNNGKEWNTVKLTQF